MRLPALSPSRFGWLACVWLIWLSAGQVSAQFWTPNSPPSLQSSAFLTADDGAMAGITLFAWSGNPTSLVWRVQIGGQVRQPVLGTTSIGGEQYLAFGQIGPFTLTDQGAPVVISVTNAFGTTTATGSLFIRGRPPLFTGAGTVNPVNVTVSRDQPASLTGTAVGSATLRYQWQKNGAPLGGATSNTLNIPSAQLSDAGTYVLVATNDYGTASSSVATLSVQTIPLAITQQPSSLSVALNATATFQVVATGTAPILYQWRKDGTNIEGATGSTLIIPAAKASDAGSYYVALTNPAGPLVSANVTLTVNVPVAPTPVTFTRQPQSAIVTRGDPVTFEVATAGTAPITYQWLKDGTPLPNATASSLAIASAQPTHAGSYSVAATNPAGTATSQSATLTVNEPLVAPAITQQPQGRDLLMGVAASFTVSATGSPPLSFQWRKNGTAVPGATLATFTLAAVQPADAGAYSVTVTNSVGNVTSFAASLSVRLPGRLVNLSLLTALGSTGESFKLGVVLGGAGSAGNLPLLVRAIGPSLAQFGVTDALPDPRLSVFSGVTLRAQNDDWAGNVAVAATAGQLGAFPLTGPLSRDAALLDSSLGVGDHTIEIAGSASSLGTVLAEIYDASSDATRSTATPRLINVSVLKSVGNGLTAGFVVGGTTEVNVLVRAIGPSLAAFGVTNPADDPRIDVLRADRTSAGANDHWSSGLSPTFIQIGAFALPAGSRDAAILLRLAPGTYTAQVTSVTPSTGLVLVEIYEVP